MKATIIHLAAAATLATGAVAQPHHHHGHMHLHKKHEEVEKRDIEWAQETETVYVIGTKTVSGDEAASGLKDGLYTVIGESTPTFTPPPEPTTTSTTPTPTPTTTSSSSSSDKGGMFIEQAVTSSSSTSTPVTTHTPKPKPKPKPTHSSSAPVGIGASFPDGEIDCSSGVPLDYGAISLDWLEMEGWSGIQKVPDFSFGIDSVISFIETAISGSACSSGSFCTYACPDGHVPTQWPKAQGATGQSIGGLYCNAQGKLERSRPEFDTICMPGAGGVKVVNKMSKNVAICRTAYPGTENMVNPLDSQPGTELEMANIKQADYYEWQGKKTTLQYYVNQPGVPIEDACKWDCDPSIHDECGNWAPSIIGTGIDESGINYLSIFPNTPTSSAKPKFNVKITGDVSMECKVENGVYSVSDAGCTTGVNPGGVATITFYD